jgi:hypothetical protein
LSTEGVSVPQCGEDAKPGSAFGDIFLKPAVVHIVGTIIASTTAAEIQVTKMMNQISNTFTTIRERFRHIAVLGGPQYAAVLRISNVEGQLYVSELNQWVWSPRSGLPSHVLADQAIEDISPLDVCRTLLLSAENTMIQLLHQMDCVRANLHKNRVAWREPGNSEDDVIIRGLFRLQVQSVSPKSSGVM